MLNNEYRSHILLISDAKWLLTFMIPFNVLFLIDCPTGTYLAYNGGDSFCFDIRLTAACADMNSLCKTLYGENSTLLNLPSYDVIEDLLNAVDK